MRSLIYLLSEKLQPSKKTVGILGALKLSEFCEPLSRNNPKVLLTTLMIFRTKGNFSKSNSFVAHAIHNFWYIFLPFKPQIKWLLKSVRMQYGWKAFYWQYNYSTDSLSTHQEYKTGWASRSIFRSERVSLIAGATTARAGKRYCAKIWQQLTRVGERESYSGASCFWNYQV